jgi:hypothetical protein
VEGGTDSRGAGGAGGGRDGAGGAGGGRDGAGDADEVRWRVPVRVPVGKLIVVGVFAGLSVVANSQFWQAVVALAAAAGMVAWAGRDLLMPVRLAADATGVTVVTGFARRIRLPWSQVDRVRVDARRRSRMLEVDAGEALHLFSRYDLDADLDEVASRLEALRTAAR